VFASQEVGSIKLAEIPAAEGGLRRSELDAHSATIFQLSQAAVRGNGSMSCGNGTSDGSAGAADAAHSDTLLVSCSRAVHPERAWAWTHGLFEALQPRQALVVSTMPVSLHVKAALWPSSRALHE
jgi:hypothetical protein